MHAILLDTKLFFCMIFWIFGRPFGAIRADYRFSRRDGCISTGRVGLRSAPRGPGDIWKLFSEVGFVVGKALMGNSTN